MANIFTQTPISRVKKNWFDLSHDHKLSTKFGYLTPTLCQEVLPGDKFVMRNENLIRFAPLISPVMHKVKVYCHYFFVPNRILWDNWEDFITGGKDGTSNPPIPRMSADSISFQTHDLPDYLGYPIGKTVRHEDFNMLAMAAYQKIFYDYYVDPNLDLREFRPLTDGNTNPINEYTFLQRRAWGKDYFTSALPWAQRGPVVTLPLGDSAPVNVNPLSLPATGEMSWSTSTPQGGRNAYAPQVETDNPYVTDGGLWADLTNATASTITDLRRAESLQQFFEKLATGGHRYFEVLQRMFGVRNLDVRLNRSEYIGGQIQDVVISEVLQTSETNETPLADMAGHAVSASRGKNVTYFAPEHGHIICMLSVMPQAAYDQGLPRMFSRSDRFDFYWEQFAHIGEQEILNKELYYDISDLPTNEETFGYTPRYAEYRYTPSRISGEFRTNLRHWHMGRSFSQRPNLNAPFIYTDPDAEYFKNVFNVTDQDSDYLWLHSYNHVKAQRPIPKFGTPRL